ncbi:hypothetical protein VPNG_07220 [Cytospora leucostoma]|uniref:Uncharacterized protein n=1 Tax=Cytospora leucostoma TaxID=1230097 RepID=A0A423WJP8_9PEZI|nr:hypothetical protein VPNG_07220 [Cytospora leucostoma]
MNERTLLPPPARPFNAVGFCLTAIRIWQWASSFFVYASFSLLYDHIQSNRLGGNEHMRGGLVSLVYSTIVVCCVHVFKTLDVRLWRVFAIMSLPGDLTIMGICLAQITILSYSGLPADCHGLTRDNYDGNDLIRQPADGFTTIRFGSWKHEISGELDELCTFPRTVYGLSVAAVFSYTFTVLFSVLYLQQQETEAPIDNEKAIERPALHDQGSASSDTQSTSIAHESSRPPSAISSRNYHSPSRSASPPQGSSYSTAPSYHSRASFRQSGWSEVGLRGGSHNNNNSSSSSNTSSSTSTSRTSTWGATTTLVGGDTDSIRSGISLPESESTISGTSSSLPHRQQQSTPGPSAQEAPPQRSWSNSTNSSYNANAFIVTNGTRPDGTADPPGYSSRPGSLYHEYVKYEAGLEFPNCSPSS